ncbi:MAG: hypothetical protein IPF78_14525 [Flavobacteriales bacterium]|nr:hypothetical protein [Flavobacteriales bacterium]
MFRTRSEDGNTLQMGIGAIPDAILRGLRDHKGPRRIPRCSVTGLPPRRLGDHGSQKRRHPGRIVTSFALGVPHYDRWTTIRSSPSDTACVNSGHAIRQNPKVVAITAPSRWTSPGSVRTASVCAVHSGVCGQMDFMRGAALRERGKFIIASGQRPARRARKTRPSSRKVPAR